MFQSCLQKSDLCGLVEWICLRCLMFDFGEHPVLLIGHASQPFSGVSLRKELEIVKLDSEEYWIYCESNIDALEPVRIHG
jgi:hypothetical protein